MTAFPGFPLAAPLLAIPLLALLGTAIPGPALADDGPVRVGEVSSTFRVLGRNDRIVVDRYDDPRVGNVSCYLSRAETGGIKGSVGLATDPSRFSIACQAIGPVRLPDRLPASETAFGASANWLFKEIRVTRLWDAERHTLVYLVWSTKAMSTGGSPYNSVSVVPVGEAAGPAAAPRP